MAGDPFADLPVATASVPPDPFADLPTAAAPQAQLAPTDPFGDLPLADAAPPLPAPAPPPRIPERRVAPVAIPEGLQLAPATQSAEDVPTFDESGQVQIPEIEDSIAQARILERELQTQIRRIDNRGSKPIWDRVNLMTEAMIHKGPLDVLDVQVEAFGRWLADPLEKDPLTRAINRTRSPVQSAIDEGVAAVNNLTDNALSEWGKELQAGALESYKKRGKYFEAKVDDPWDEMFLSAGQSTATSLLALGTSVITRSPYPGLSIFGYTAGKQAELTALMEGAEPQKAEYYGFLSGLVEAGTETLPLKSVLTSNPFMKKLTGFMFKELGGELTATLMDHILQTAVLNKDFSVEDLKHDLAITAGATLLGAPLQGGAAHVTQKAMDINLAFREINETTRREKITGALEAEYTELRKRAMAELEALGKIDTDEEILVFHGSPAGDLKVFQQKYIPDESYDGGIADAWGVYLSDRAEYSAQERYLQKDTIPESLGKINYNGLQLDQGATPDTIRVYRGGEFDKKQSTWATAHQSTAEGWANQYNRPGEVYYTDMPRAEFERMNWPDPSPGVIPITEFQVGPEVTKGFKLLRPEAPKGRVYEVRISKYAPLLQWETPLTRQSPEVRQLLKENGVEINERTAHEMYQELEAKKFKGKGSARKTSKLLLSWGIEGTVMERRSKFGKHKVYSLFDQHSPKIIKLGREQGKFEEMKAQLENFNSVREDFANNPPELKFREKWTNFTTAVDLSLDKRYELAKENLKFNQYLKYFAGLEDLARLPENQEFGPLKNYLKVTRERHATWGKWVSKAATHAGTWESMIGSKEKEQAINEFLELVATNSAVRKKYLNVEDMQALNKTIGGSKLTPQDIQFLAQTNQHYQEAFAAMEQELFNLVDWEISEDDQALRARLKQEIRDNFKPLKERNYLPKFWFGDYITVVRKGDEPVARYAYRTEWERQAGEAEVKKKYGEGYKLHRTMASEGRANSRSFEGVPDSFLEELGTIMGWSDAEEQIAKDAQISQRPIMNIGKRFQQQDALPGWNKDYFRAYTTFFSSFANRMASIGYDHLLQNSINAAAPPVSLANADQRQMMTDWMRRHREYLRNPGDEWQSIRTIAFNWYIGWVPASAFANLMQVPIFTHRMLAKTFGEIDATKALASAISKRFGDFKHLTLPNGKVIGKLTGYAGTGYNREELDLIKRALETVLDEGQGMVLGAISHENALQKASGNILGGSRRTNRFIRKVMDSASVMFSGAETFNRAITLTAAYNLARNQGMEVVEAQEYAMDMVRRSQGEYARYNRPELFRGPKSAAFLFMHYITQMMFILGNDPGRWRIIAMIFAMAGFKGLPFAEDLGDVYDSIMQMLGKAAGVKDPKTDLLQDVKEFTQGLIDDPTIPMAETIRNLTGVDGAALSSFFAHGAGSLIPNPLDGGQTTFDISGHIGFGDIIPFTEMFKRSQDFEHTVANATRDAGGAVIGIPLNLMQGAYEHGEHQDWYRTIEKTMPTSIRNITRMMKWGLRGAEEGKIGDDIARFRTFEDALEGGKYQDLAPHILQGMGFQPSAVVQAKNKRFVFQDSLAFYNTWRTRVYKQVEKAFLDEDPEAIAESMKAVKKFNSATPDPTLLIGPKILDSLKQRSRVRVLREIGTTPTSSGRGLANELLDTGGTVLDFRTE